MYFTPKRQMPVHAKEREICHFTALQATRHRRPKEKEKTTKLKRSFLVHGKVPA